jgi:ADP-ribose pyrophosphatase YjhB (NUDIX family)
VAGGGTLEERWVVTSFLEDRGRVLLLRRSGRVGTYQGLWAGISGGFEPGRTPLEQAVVEIGEETGLAPEDVQLVETGEQFDVVDQGIGRLWHIQPFRFAALRPEKLRLDWEHTEARWVSVAEAAAYDTVPGLAEAMRRVGLKGA